MLSHSNTDLLNKLLDENILDLLNMKLEDSEVPQEVKKELLWGISNMATVSKEIRDRIVHDKGIIPTV